MDTPTEADIAYIKLVENIAGIIKNQKGKVWCQTDYYRVLRLSTKFRKTLVAVGRNRKNLLQDAKVASEVITNELISYSFTYALEKEKSFLEVRKASLWFRFKLADNLRYRLFWNSYSLAAHRDNIMITNAT